jgi:uncharacterized protein with FMN-binding domain
MAKIKRNLIIVGILIAVVLIGVFALYTAMKKSQTTYNTFDFGGINLSEVEDGIYTGSEDGGIVKASVEVTIKDHVITDITILSHDCGLGKPAEVIIEDIIEGNSLEVDTVSGATYSSDVIRMAVYNAVTK